MNEFFFALFIFFLAASLALSPVLDFFLFFVSFLLPHLSQPLYSFPLLLHCFPFPFPFSTIPFIPPYSVLDFFLLFISFLLHYLPQPLYSLLPLLHFFPSFPFLSSLLHSSFSPRFLPLLQVFTFIYAVCLIQFTLPVTVPGFFPFCNSSIHFKLLVTLSIHFYLSSHPLHSFPFSSTFLFPSWTVAFHFCRLSHPLSSRLPFQSLISSPS